MALASIEVGLLFEVVWASPSPARSCRRCSRSSSFRARSAETRRAGRGTVAMAYGAAAVLSFAAFMGLVVYGVHLMLSKG